MTRPLAEAQRWEDPIVAEVRKAREKLFAAAGYDLDEFCRQLNAQQEREGGRAPARPLRVSKRGAAEGSLRPNKRSQRTRGKNARR
jgi:hypothetical protein